MLEQQLKEREISIGEQKGTSIFYSDTVNSSFGKEAAGKTSVTEYSAGIYNEAITLNNFKIFHPNVQKLVKTRSQ